MIASLLLPGALVLVAAGCGSPSSSSPTTASAGTHLAWHVFSKRTTRGRAVGTVGGTVPAPKAMRVQVDADPEVESQVDYSVDCEQSATHPVTGTLAIRRTPLTAPIPVTGEGPSCFVDITASKSAPTAMTLTLMVQSAR